MTMRRPWREDEKNVAHELNMADATVFGFSWLLVVAFGLMPIVDASLKRSPVISMPLTISFFVAVAGGLVLRRRFGWLGLVLYIFGQIAIWLSVFCISFAAVLYASG